MYPKSDHIDIMRLARVASPNNNDIDLIYHYYKKYINENAQPPVMTNCGCDRDISSYWKKIKIFGSENSEKFNL